MRASTQAGLQFQYRMAELLRQLIAKIDRGAWIRFFVALLGLTFAFVAALLSTVANDAGNSWAAVILASASLILAAVVGIAVVPYLAKRVVIRQVRDALNYEVTREGAIYLVLALVIGIAALNTGNNLLFIVVSAMLAAVVVSGIASAIVLLGLELEVIVPEHLFAGSVALARLVLRNTNRVVPSFSVSVVPPKEKMRRKHISVHRSSFRFPPNSKPGKEWFMWPDLSVRWTTEPPVPTEVFRGKVYFPFIPARQSAHAEVELSFPKRGSYVQSGFGLQTKFPFAFLNKTRTIAMKREVIVYPSVQATDEFFEMLPLITGEFETYVRGRGYDLYLIRDYAAEDSARHVDWKATARTGDLKVREFTREDERKLRLVFDNPAPGAISRESYERGVALAASLAWHFAADTTELSFAAPGYTGSSDVYDFLRYAALVQPGDAASILDSLDVTDDYNIVLTARKRGSIPTPLWNSSYFVFLD
jgi:uncharacterized protein (DUF58 family)